MPLLPKHSRATCKLLPVQCHLKHVVKRRACTRLNSGTDLVTGGNTTLSITNGSWMQAADIPPNLNSPHLSCKLFVSDSRPVQTRHSHSKTSLPPEVHCCPASARQLAHHVPAPLARVRPAAALLCIRLVVLGPREDLLVLLRGGVPAAVALHAAQLQRAEGVRVLAQRDQRRVQRRLERLRRARRERPPGAGACARAAPSQPMVQCAWERARSWKAGTFPCIACL